MTVLELSNIVAIPFWLLMMLLPHWSVTRRVIASPWIIVPPSLLYLVTFVPVAGLVFPEVANPVPARIMALLGTPTGTSLAWAHFVAFDLFVGRWIYLDSRSRQYSALWVSPLLLATLLIGPIGFLGYLLARTAIGGATSVDTVDA